MLQHTPLYPIYAEYGARLTEFSGYEMPLRYELGVKAEHLWCREHAALFDISHMGQAWIVPKNAQAELVPKNAQAWLAPKTAQARLASENEPSADCALEKLVGADLQALAPGHLQYTQLLNERGGILDDLIVGKPLAGPGLYVVVNAACKKKDFAYIEQNLGHLLRIEPLEDRALLALQGPKAVGCAQKVFSEVFSKNSAEISLEIPKLGFMNWRTLEFRGKEIYISRAGYTGEDGLEISVPGDLAPELARTLLSEKDVKLCGLGARDSLRLEAGFCLYGADLDEQTTPVEAALLWSIGVRRRTEGGFAGAEVIQQQIEAKSARRRVGLDIQSKAPCRAGVPIYESAEAGAKPLGEVCSGGFSPCLEKPIAMAYLPRSHSRVGTPLWLELRGRRLPARVCKLPFVPHRYAG